MPATDRIDPRCTRSQQKVLAAAVALLRDDGLPGLTFEAVAARSGVAKSTVYRHYPDRATLHLAAVAFVGPTMVMPLTDDVVADVTAFLRDLNHTLFHSDFGAILLTALDGAERQPEMADMARTVATRRKQMLTRRLQAAQRAGQLDAAVDLEVVTGQLVGSLFYRRFMSRQTTPASFVGSLADGVLTPLLSRTRPPAPTSAAAPRAARRRPTTST